MILDDVVARSNSDEEEEDKWDMTGSSSYGEAMDEVVVRKSKRFVKRRVKGTRRQAESSDDDDEGTKQQRRKRKFSGRVNTFPPQERCVNNEEVLSEEMSM